MAEYLITRKFTPTGKLHEQRTRYRRDAAYRAYCWMLYDALKSESLLDQPIAHKVMQIAVSAIKSTCTMQGQSVGEWYVRFEKVR